MSNKKRKEYRDSKSELIRGSQKSQDENRRLGRWKTFAPILLVLAFSAIWYFNHNNKDTISEVGEVLLETQFAIDGFKQLSDCLYRGVNDSALQYEDTMLQAKMNDLKRQIKNLSLYVGAYEEGASDIDIYDLERETKRLKQNIDQTFSELALPEPNCQMPNLIING